MNVTKLSRFFTRRELDKASSRGVYLCADPDLVAILLCFADDLRLKADRPLVITSAYRSPRRNLQLGGATGSRHQLGHAFDLVMLEPHNVGSTSALWHDANTLIDSEAYRDHSLAALHYDSHLHVHIGPAYLDRRDISWPRKLA